MGAGFSRELAACQRLMRGGSHSFFVASRLLPRDMREAAVALYAFCRVADDAIDGVPPPLHSVERPGAAPDEGCRTLRTSLSCRHLPGGSPQAALTRLRERLVALYAGHPVDHPADRAFSQVVQAYQVPIGLPELLLEGFAWDLEGRRYATIAALEAYAARVAGTVGAMMALIMGVSCPQALARACELGLAMQLTNIARDVGEDARAGRLYLPLDWLAQAQIDPERLVAAPRHCPKLGSVVARLLAHADILYAQANTALAALPWSCRPAIAAASKVYAEIGREVERGGLDAINRRAVVATSRKLMLLATALGSVACSSWPLGRGRQGPTPPPRDPWQLSGAQGIHTQGIHTQGIHTQGIHTQGIHTQGMHMQGMRASVAELVHCAMSAREHKQRVQKEGVEGGALYRVGRATLHEGQHHAPRPMSPGTILRRKTKGFGQLAELFERLERIDREDRARQHPGFHEASGEA